MSELESHVYDEISIPEDKVTPGGLPEDLLNFWPLAVGGFMASTAEQNPELLKKPVPNLEEYIVNSYGSGAVDAYKASSKYNAESEKRYNELAIKYNSILGSGIEGQELLNELKSISVKVAEIFNGEI